MSHLEQSVLNEQKYFNSNRTNSHIVGNPEVSIEFGSMQFQMRNDLAQIGEKNLKLKEDYAINNAKLIGQKTNIVQQKRMSSMDNIQIGNQWMGKQANLQFSHGLQFRKNTQQLAHNFIPSQKIIIPQPNQQNRGDFTNMTQITTKTSTEVESLTIQIREHIQQITQLQKSEQTYKREVSTYKEMVNKVQSILHEKESLLIGERTQILKQKEIISELERQLVEQKGSQNTQKGEKMTEKCGNCDDLLRKISQLTKKMTELSNQLNAKTEKIRLMQEGDKGLRTLEAKNNELHHQINKMQIDFQKSSSSYQNEIYLLQQQLSSRTFNSQNQRQLILLREQNIQLRSELEETEKMTQERFGELMRENEYLNNQVEGLRRVLEERNDNSRMSESQQSTVLVEYERSIQALQDEINVLRKELHQKQSSTSTNSTINQLRIDNNVYFERMQQQDAEIAFLNKELQILKSDHNQFSSGKSQQSYIKQISQIRHQLQCSKKMIAQLFAKIEQNNEQDTRTEQELQNRYKQTVQRYMHELQTATGQLKHKEVVAIELEKELHLLRGKMFGLEQEASRLLNQLLQSNQKYEEAYSGLIRAENYIEEQEKRVYELENQLNILSVPQGNEEHLLTELNQKQVMITELETEINQKQTLITQLETELTKLHNQCAFLGNQIRRLNELNANLNRNNQELFKENQLSRTEITSLQKQLISVQSKQIPVIDSTEFEQLKQKVITFQKQKNTALFDGQIVKQKLLEAEQFILVISQEIQEKNLQISQMTISLDKKDNSNRLEKENSELKQRIISSQRQLSQLKHSSSQQLTSLRQQLTNQSTELTHLQNIISTKEKELYQLRQTKDELSRYISLEQSKQTQNQNIYQTTELNEQLKNYQKLIEELQNEKNSLHQHLQNAESYIFEFEQKNYAQIVDELHLVIGGLENERNNLLSRQKELEYLLYERNEENQNVNSTKTAEYEQKITTYLKQINVLKEKISIIQRQLSRLNELNTQLQQKITSLTQQNMRFHNRQQTLQTRHLQDLQQMRLRIRQLETQRQTFLQNVDNMKNKLLAEQPQTISQLDKSRVKVDKFIEENHRIIENLRRAENHIQQMELRCEEYLAEIDRLKNGINANFSMRESRKTIKDVLDDESQLDKTPIRKIDNSSFDQSMREDDTLMLRIGELQETILAMRREIEGRDDYIKNLEGKVSSLERERETLNQNVSRLAQAAAAYEITIREVAALDTQKREFERLIVRLENDKSVLKAENERLNQTIPHQSDTNSNEIKKLERVISELEGRIGPLEKENAKLADKIVKSSEENQRQLLEIKNLQTGRFQLEELYQKSRDEMTRISKENIKLTGQLHDAQATIQTLSQANQNLTEPIDQLEDKSHSLQQTISSNVMIKPLRNSEQVLLLKAELERKELELKEVVNHLNHAEAFIAENEVVFVKGEQERAETAVKMGEMAVKMGELERSVVQLTEVNEGLKRQLNTKNQSVVINLQQEKSLLQNKVTELQQIIKSLKTQNRNLQEQLFVVIQTNVQSPYTQQQQQLKLLKTQNHSLKNQHQSLVSEIQQWQEEVSNLNSQIVQFKKVEQQYVGLMNDVEKMNREYHGVVDQLNRKMEQERLDHSQVLEKLITQHNISLQKVTDQNKFLQDSIAQLNSLIEKDRKTINELNDQLTLLNQRHNQQLLILRNQLEQTITSQHDSDYIQQLENHVRETEDSRNQVFIKLKQAEGYIVYLEQEKQVFLNGQTATKTKGISEEHHNEVLEKLVHAESVIMELEKQLNLLNQLRDTLSKENDELIQLNQTLQKQKSQLFITHDEKIAEINLRNFRIHEELQQTVIRVSEEHMQLVSILERVETEKKTFENQLAFIKQSQEKQNFTKETNARILEEMKATISRISQENKILLSENREVDGLRDEIQKLNKTLSEKSVEKNNQLEDIERFLKEKTQQVEEFEKALEAQVQQVYQVSTELTKTQQELAQKNETINQLTQTTTSLSQQNIILRSELTSLAETKQTLQQNQSNNYTKMSESLNEITQSLKQKSEVISSLEASLKNERSKSLEVEKARAFFEAKLLEAEEFIAETEKDKRELAQKYHELHTELERLRLSRIDERPNEEADLEANNSSIANISAIMQNDDKLKELKETVENQQSMIKELTSKIYELHVQIDSKEHDLAEKRREIQSLKEAFRSLEQEKLSTSVNVVKLNEKITTLNSNATDLQKIITGLEKNLNDERELHEELKKNVLQQTASSNKKLEEANHTILIIQSSLSEKDKQISQLQDVIKKLEDQKFAIELSGREAFSRELEAHKRLNEELIKANKESNNELNLLREKALEGTEAKHRLHELEIKLKEKESIETQLRGKLRDVENKLIEAKEEVKKLINEKENIQQVNDQLNLTRANLEKEMKEVKSQNDHLVEQLVEAESQATKHEHDMKQLQQLKNSSEKLLNSKITQLNDHLSGLAQNRDSLTNQLTTISQELTNLHSLIAQKDTTITQLHQVIDASQQTSNIQAIYEQKIKENMKRIEDLLNQLNFVNQQNFSLNKELNELKPQIKQLNDLVAQLKAENSQFTSLHEHLMEEISEEHIKVQKKEEQFKELQQLFEAKETEIIFLQKAIETQKADIHNLLILKEKLFEAENYIKFLEQKLASNETLKKSVQEKSDLLSSRELQISNLSVDLKEITSKLNEKEEELLLSHTELLSIKKKITLMEQKIEEEERAKILLKQQLEESVENSHELSLINERLNETERHLLAERLKNKDLELRNQQLTEKLVNVEVQYTELESQNRNLANRLNDLQQRHNHFFDSLQNTNILLEAENTQLKDQLQQLSLRVQDLIQQHSATKLSSQEEVDEIQELKLKLLEKEQELESLIDEITELNVKVGNYEIDIENYKKIIQENAKENILEEDLEKLKDNLKNADSYITNLDQRFNHLNDHNLKLQNQANFLKLELSQSNDVVAQLKAASVQDQSTIAQLQSTIVQIQPQTKPSSQTKIPSSEDLSSIEKITKIVQKLTKYVEQNDSLDIYLEENIERDLSSNPIFKTLYETIKYKLRLLNAIDKEKTVSLFEKEKLAEELGKTIRKLEDQRKEMHEKVSQAEMLQTSYHEVQAKLIEMERHNLSLENEVNQLNSQLSLHKSQIEEFQSKLQNESSSLSGQGDKIEHNINGGDLLIDQRLKEENLRLRKELQQALYQMHRLKNNTSNFESFHNSTVMSPLLNKRITENNQFFKEFLKDCLMAVGGLEEAVAGIEKDLMGNRQNIQKLLTNKIHDKPALGSKGSEDSWMLEKIQQLEEKLLENQQKLKEHKNQTEMELISLVRQTLITPLTNQANTLSLHFDRQKVETYLRDLEDIILKKDLAHDEQINRLKSISQQKHHRNDSSISPHKEFENERGFDVDELLKEITGLNKHIQYYHAETDRRKAQYKRTIEDLLKEIELLKKQYEAFQPSIDKKPVTSLIDNIVAKTKSLLDQQSLQDFDQKSDYLNDDDFIVSNNYVQWITKKGANEESPNKEEEHFVHDLKSIAEEFQNKESSIPSRNNLSNAQNNQNPTSVENKILNFSNNVSKQELLSRPILEFIVQNKDFDETEIDLLKKKINEIQARNNQEKMRLLKEHEQKITDLLTKYSLLKENQSNETQTEAALNALCSNLTKQQIEKLVTCAPEQMSEEMMIRIQEVISNSSLQGSSFLKSESNPYEMMQAILETKNKHYPEPTPLSEEMFHHLIKLLSSKDDQEFYALIDSLFAYLSILENDFLHTLKQKEEMYQKHTEKMNQVLGLNESSDEELNLQDEEYYKRILLLTKDEQAEIEKIRKEQTEKGIEEQLQEELRKAVNEQGKPSEQNQEAIMKTI